MDARTEIISQVERRRRWSVEDKVRLLEATMQPGASVAAVADRHGVSRSLLFYWRKQAKAGLMPGVTPLASLAAPVFAPVIVAAEALPGLKSSPKPPRKMAPRSGCMVEVTLGNGRVLKADEGIAPERLSALVAALDR
jgi:transposase